MESSLEKNLQLKLSRLGYFLVYKKNVPSTIDLAAGINNKNIPCAIIAAHQTRGVGRYGHTWHDKKGGSILMTIIENDYFFKKITPALLAQLFVLSCCLTLGRITKNKNIKIKWPNDLVIDDKKLGGVLTDCASRKDATLISLGLNVRDSHVKNSSFLQSLSEKELDRANLIGDILAGWKKDKKSFEKKWKNNDCASYTKLWTNKSSLIGRNIQLLQDDVRQVSGEVKSTPLGGGLTIKAQGRTIKIKLGDYLPGSIIINN